MQYRYGNFPKKQISNVKTQIHKEMFYLLLYKDPKTSQNFSEVNFPKYYENFMRKLNGFNRLLNYPTEIVSIMSLLEAAYIETEKDDFDYRIYRKLVLDAHALVDRINEKEAGND